MSDLHHARWPAVSWIAVLLLAACGKDAAMMNTASAGPTSDVGHAGAGADASGSAGETRASSSGGDGGARRSGSAGDGGAAANGGAAGNGGAAASPGAAAVGGRSGSEAGVGGASPASGTGGTSANPSPRAGVAGAAGSSAAAGGGGSPPPALGPDCAADPLASKRPYGSGFYQQFTGLFGCTATADVALYRKLLPDKFEMPADPQVCFYTIDFKISGVGPYHEAAILLPVTYKGETGKYVLTMDLDNSLATSGGRAVGFPKYMGQVTLEQAGNDWVGTASANGEVDLKASYTGECNDSDQFLWPDFINLTPIPSGTTSSQAFLPPRTGSVLRVPAEYLEPPAFHSLKGSIKLEINDKLPWNGLIDETKAFPGLLSSFVGGVDLGNQPLD
jgi:hypothetical protein